MSGENERRKEEWKWRNEKLLAIKYAKFFMEMVEFST